MVSALNSGSKGPGCSPRRVTALCSWAGHLGRVLLGLLRNRNTQNRRYLCSFGSYSVHSAPGSRMNRMKEYCLLGIDRIRVLLGNVWREILCGYPLRSRAQIYQFSGHLRFRFQI